MNRTTGMLLLVGVCAFGIAIPSARAANPYYFCNGQEIGKSRFFYSDAFQGGRGDAVSYPSAFKDFVKAHYDANVIAVCDSGSGYTQSEAKAKRDEDAALRRRVGNEVVFTNWTY